MEVINRPDTSNTPPMPPFDDNDGNGGQGDGSNEPKKGFHHPKKKLGWLIAGRAAFVICGAMFVIMIIGTFISIYIITAAPYLAPNVPDTKLRQDKIYIKFDDEDFYHELAIIKDQPVDLDPVEVTQIPQNRNFTLIFTPKQLANPEEYNARFKSGVRSGEIFTNNLEVFEIRQTKNKGEESFNIVAIRPLPGKQWSIGRYELSMPSPGMFAAGKFFAYVTVNEK
jgi:hypothetical protein